MGISESSAPSLAERIGFTFVAQIHDDLPCFRIGDDGSDRDFDDQIFSLGTVHLLRSSIFTILSTERMGMTEIR